MEITKYPEPNFSLCMGEGDGKVCFDFRVSRTVLNRIKYWLFCKFFPFTIEKWEPLAEE